MRAWLIEGILASAAMLIEHKSQHSDACKDDLHAHVSMQSYQQIIDYVSVQLTLAT